MLLALSEFELCRGDLSNFSTPMGIETIFWLAEKMSKRLTVVAMANDRFMVLEDASRKTPLTAPHLH